MKRIEHSTERGFGGSAMLFQRGGALGRFDVQQISTSGALLTGARDVRRTVPLRVLLELPSGEAVSVPAHVKRSRRAGDVVSLAVGFLHLTASSEDRFQDALLGLLDASHRASHPAVLVVDRSPDGRALLAARVAELGRRVLTAAAPLDALRTLDDPRANVDAIVARHDRGVALELLTLVSESYPHVRPILYADEPLEPGIEHDTVRSATGDDLAAALA